MPSDDRTVVTHDTAHLGEGVYVGHDKQGRVWLYTGRNGFVDNSICMDAWTLASFTRWVKDHRGTPH